MYAGINIIGHIVPKLEEERSGENSAKGMEGADRSAISCMCVYKMGRIINQLN